MWTERWFLSCNAKDIGTLYLIFALFSGLVGTAFSVLIRLELAGPGVQYIADNQLYNSIITAHAILMIFFMVEKSLNALNMKSQPSLHRDMENDSDNNNVVEIGNDNNNNDDKDPKKPKYKYVKVIVNDPFNNRDIILKFKGRGSCVGGYSGYRKAKHENSYSTGYKENTHRKYSTLTRRAPLLNKNVASSFSKLHPQFITGFIDGKGCFSITIARHSKLKLGWGIKLIFSISLHEKDKALLEQIQNYFGVGKIWRSGDQLIQLRIESKKELALIIDHLEKYPLISKKRAVFEAFKQAFNIIKNKEHLTREGLEKIKEIKAGMNSNRK